MKENNQPLVSVVIPCYNHEKFVQDCIQSVIDQTYQNIELIIIDDGSKDSSVEIIEKMLPACEQRFVRFEFRNRPNKGLSATLNESIAWSKGKYFAALASDDIILKNKINLQVKYMEENPKTTAVFGSANYIDENNNIKTLDQLKQQEYVFDKIFLNECQFYAPTQLMRKSTLDEVGGYDPDILVEDWYMWLKMAEKGSVYCLSDTFANYRIHSNNTTKNSKFIYDNNMKTLSFYKDHSLYDKAYSKLRWTYIVWTGQQNKALSFKLLLEYIMENPSVIFNRGFLVYCKYFFVKMKDWF